MFTSRAIEKLSNHCSDRLKSYFAPRNYRDFAERKTTLQSRLAKIENARAAALIFAGLVLLGAVFGPRCPAADQFLFKGNFSQLEEKWEIVDVADPESGRPTKSAWRVGIAELSAIENEDDEDVATILLAGEKSWENYSVDATLFSTSDRYGYLTGIVFGYRDPQQFYHVGYNFYEECYELKRRTPDGVETLAREETGFPERQEVLFHLEFAGSAIRFHVGDRKIFDLKDGTYTKGQIGLGTSGMGAAAVLFGPITVNSLDPSDPATAGKQLFSEDFSLGTLDRWQVWDSTDADPTRSDWRIVVSEFAGVTNKLDKAAAFLLTGDESWNSYAVRTNLFSSGFEGNLTGIVFGYRDQKHFFHVGYNASARRFELEVCTPQGYEILSFAELEFPADTIVPLELRFSDQRILFLIRDRIVFDIQHELYSSGRVGVATSDLGNGDVALTGFEVVASLPKDVTKRPLQDLLTYKTGGGVIYRPTPTLGDPFKYLFDRSLSDVEKLGARYELELADVKLPEAAVLSFPQGRFAEIHRLGIKLEAKHFPKEIHFWVSDQTPKSGFKPLTTVTLRPESESYQEFPVPPTRAKYLKLQITKGFDSEQIQIDEIFVKGYFEQPAVGLGESESLGMADIQEQEPNNSLETAQTLPSNKSLRASVGQQDIDCFRILPPADAEQPLTLQLRNIGILRPQFRLFTADGTEVEPSEEAPSRGITRVSYPVEPVAHYLQLVRPETYLTIVFDDSSSMGESIPIVKRVLTGYLEKLGPELNVKIVKYAKEPIDLCDFTNDSEELKAAIKGEIGGGGATATFDGLMWAVKSVTQKDGNRAVLAILDMINPGKDPDRQYRELWDAVLDNGVNFTTIGVQSGWDKRTEFFGNSRAKIFRELAYSTRGQFFHSPSDELVKQNAEAIFKQLTAPVRYSVTASWKPTAKMVPKTVPTVPVPSLPNMASLSVRRQSGLAGRQTTLPALELILDSSNSMSEKVGNSAKSQVAREVVDGFLAELAQETQLGLRLYGHRGVWIERATDPDAGPLPLTDPRLNTDSELVVPIGPLTSSRLSEIRRWLDDIKPTGKTPLVYSLLQAVHDFPEDAGKPRAVILVSDGKENCGGKLSDVAKAYRGSQIDLVIHVVGFDLERDWDAKRQLGAIARLGRGKYFDARDAAELKSALTTAVQTYSFDVLDRVGRRRLTGGIVGGDPIRLEPGQYLVQIVGETSQPASVELQAAQSVEVVWADSGQLTVPR